MAFSGASVSESAGQSATSGSNVVCAPNTEAFDSDAYHEGVTHPSRLTAPQTGYYFVSGWIEWTASSSSYRQATIEKNANGTPNSGTQIATVKVSAAATGVTQLVVCGLASLTAGDYVEFWGSQGSGSTLTQKCDTFSIQLVN